MTTPTSGAISIKDVSTEVNLPSVSENSLNNALSRGLAGVPTGTISLANMYGKSSSGSPFSGTSLNTRVLIVGGGGGGGTGTRGDNRLVSGGGGAGGYISQSLVIASGTTTVTVGGGGGSNGAGGNSTVTSLTAIGGGRGGQSDNGGGGSGGSGGGGAEGSGGGGAGTAGQGNNGGNAGGGGGASAAGTNGGPGGAGTQWTNGTYYAGGGGRCYPWPSGALYPGGIGGGGAGLTSGTANTGGGGGGGRQGTGSGSGGSGIVIISYDSTFQIAGWRYCNNSRWCLLSYLYFFRYFRILIMQIINDFIKPRIQNDIEALLMGGNFPYFYSNESCVPAGYKEDKSEDSRLTGDILVDDNTIEAPQFMHMLVSDSTVNSASYNSVAPILNKVVDMLDGDYFVAKCKVNMNLADVRFEGKYHTPHIDNGFDDQVTAIYYVNDSDGDTFFFDGDGKVTKRITPKKGTLVMWKGKVFHAKSSPIKTTSRVVININLLPY